MTEAALGCLKTCQYMHLLRDLHANTYKHMYVMSLTVTDRLSLKLKNMHSKCPWLSLTANAIDCKCHWLQKCTDSLSSRLSLGCMTVAHCCAPRQDSALQVHSTCTAWDKNNVGWQLFLIKWLQLLHLHAHEVSKIVEDRRSITRCHSFDRVATLPPIWRFWLGCPPNN